MKLVSEQLNKEFYRKYLYVKLVLITVKVGVYFEEFHITKT